MRHNCEVKTHIKYQSHIQNVMKCVLYLSKAATDAVTKFLSVHRIITTIRFIDCHFLLTIQIIIFAFEN
jgi:hypothetical protein